MSTLQLKAVSSVVRLFEGLPRYDEAFRLGDEVVANLPPYQELADSWLLDNLTAVQKDNGLPLSTRLERDTGPGLPRVEDRDFSVPHFTVEMETGTARPTSTCARSTSCASTTAGASSCLSHPTNPSRTNAAH